VEVFGVVFVHYRIPQWRLDDHFRWNDLYYRKGAMVFVVTEGEMVVPDYAVCLPYPEPMEMFNLCKTKNYGIQAALEAGCDPIAVIDTDIAWTPQTWLNSIAVRNNGIFYHPIAWMAQSWEEREAKRHPDTGMGCCMVASAPLWQQVQYDERYVGYGSDDWKIIHDLTYIGRARMYREGFIYHIAHNPDADQTNPNGHGRADCWNRDTGFNPDNASQNNMLTP
jgi:hypothetical protein